MKLEEPSVLRSFSTQSGQIQIGSCQSISTICTVASGDGLYAYDVSDKRVVDCLTVSGSSAESGNNLFSSAPIYFPAKSSSSSIGDCGKSSFVYILKGEPRILRVTTLGETMDSNETACIELRDEVISIHEYSTPGSVLIAHKDDSLSVIDLASGKVVREVLRQDAPERTCLAFAATPGVGYVQLTRNGSQFELFTFNDELSVSSCLPLENAGFCGDAEIARVSVHMTSISQFCVAILLSTGKLWISNGAKKSFSPCQDDLIVSGSKLINIQFAIADRLFCIHADGSIRLFDTKFNTVIKKIKVDALKNSDGILNLCNLASVNRLMISSGDKLSVMSYDIPKSTLRSVLGVRAKHFTSNSKNIVATEIVKPKLDLNESCLCKKVDATILKDLFELESISEIESQFEECLKKLELSSFEYVRDLSLDFVNVLFCRLVSLLMTDENKSTNLICTLLLSGGVSFYRCKGAFMNLLDLAEKDEPFVWGILEHALLGVYDLNEDYLARLVRVLLIHSSKSIDSDCSLSIRSELLDRSKMETFEQMPKEGLHLELLSVLLARPFGDHALLSTALKRHLPSAEAISPLLDYLSVWVSRHVSGNYPSWKRHVMPQLYAKTKRTRRFRRFLSKVDEEDDQVVPNLAPSTASSYFITTRKGLQLRPKFVVAPYPSSDQVVKWTNCIINAHYTSLVLDPTRFSSTLAQMRDLATGELANLKQMVSFKTQLYSFIKENEVVSESRQGTRRHNTPLLGKMNYALEIIDLSLL